MSLKLAVEYAKKNPIKARGRTSMPRIAAVLTDGFSFITGFNSYKTCPVQASFGTDEFKVHRHAEVAALKEGARRRVRFKDYTMYVARVLADGRPANAAPCTGCMAAIKKFGVKRVIHT